MKLGLAQIRAFGRVQMFERTDAQRAAWKKLWPVHMEMESRVGAAMFDGVYKAAGRGAPQ